MLPAPVSDCHYSLKEQWQFNIRERAMNDDLIKDVAKELSHMWDQGHNFMNLARYSIETYEQHLTDTGMAISNTGRERGEFPHPIEIYYENSKKTHETAV